MKYAIMSDVHSNPVALETALTDARSQGCGKFLLLGDITGYGYDGKKALDVVRENFDLVLLGNHDSACLGRERAFIDQINPNYDIDRTQHEQLTDADLEWLGSKELLAVIDGMALTHGDFIRPEAWGYIVEGRDAAMNFCVRGESVMFCGHTHHLSVWRNCEGVPAECISEKRFGILQEGGESVVFSRRKGERYIVNVGSVGYPRNDLCSSYAICDPEEDEFILRRLPFDFASYIANMLERKIELPQWLCRILRIAAGK